LSDFVLVQTVVVDEILMRWFQIGIKI